MMESTTVKVSKETLRQLASLQQSTGSPSLDETIKLLVRQHRSDILSRVFGMDRGKLRSFTEEDRGEDRS